MHLYPPSFDMSIIRLESELEALIANGQIQTKVKSHGVFRMKSLQVQILNFLASSMIVVIQIGSQHEICANHFLTHDEITIFRPSLGLGDTHIELLAKSTEGKKIDQQIGEIDMTTQFIPYAKVNSISPACVPGKPAVFAQTSVNFLGYNYLPRKLKFNARQLRSFGAVKTAESETTATTDGAARWLLEPVGSGDFRHIGYKISRPGAFEIASDVVSVGRVPEKADIVIPVPTVSGLHAKIQKSEETLLITDLDSTNGTFIGEKRLQPGIAYAAASGNLVTFGDTNLAIFRVYKLEKDELSDEPEESGA